MARIERRAMDRKTLRIVGWLAGACVLGACAAREFNLRDTTALELGRLRESEYPSLFGNASSVRSTDVAGEPRKIVWFESGSHTPDRSCGRTLRLEFREQTLNAYLGSSSCRDDATSVDRRKIDDLKPALGKMSREELATSLPRPAGKARCPTALSEYRTRCDQGALEVWAWLSASDPLGSERAASTTLALVSFDAQGKLQDARIEEYGRTGGN
jgi:hypothetical protein